MLEVGCTRIIDFGNTIGMLLVTSGEIKEIEKKNNQGCWDEVEKSIILSTQVSFVVKQTVS